MPFGALLLLGLVDKGESRNMFFFFNDTATTEIYTLSLHDALPICGRWPGPGTGSGAGAGCKGQRRGSGRDHDRSARRSEEHTSELQSHLNLVCRLLLEKKNSRLNASKARILIPLSWQMQMVF